MHKTLAVLGTSLGNCVSGNCPGADFAHTLTGFGYPLCSVAGLADACLVPQMDNARRFNCELSPCPRLLAVDAECRTLEAFRQAAPAMQPDYPGA